MGAEEADMWGNPVDRHKHRARRISGISSSAGAQSFDCVYLESVDRCTAIVDFNEHQVAALIIDDLCWSIATSDWATRRPPLWRRKNRAAWRAEGELLHTTRHGLRRTADRVGIRP
jgi:hypothetical protein